MLTVNNSEYDVTAENLHLKLIVSRTNEEADALWRLTLHSHAYVELFCCAFGSLQIKTQTESFLLSSGDILIMPPGVAHCTIAPHETTTWCSSAFFLTQNRVPNTQDLYSPFSALFLNNEPAVYREQTDICRKIISLMNTSLTDPFPALRMLAILAEMIPVAKTAPLSSTENLLCNLESLINTDFMKPLTISGIANELHISERQLSRIVQKRYGDSLHHVLMQKRMETAVSMLNDTDRRVEEICYDVGFRSVSVFYQEFRRRYHTTPSAYRKTR